VAVNVFHFTSFFNYFLQIIVLIIQIINFVNNNANIIHEWKCILWQFRLYLVFWLSIFRAKVAPRKRQKASDSTLWGFWEIAGVNWERKTCRPKQPSGWHPASFHSTIFHTLRARQTSDWQCQPQTESAR
jgi:hypothetical protein